MIEYFCPWKKSSVSSIYLFLRFSQACEIIYPFFFYLNPISAVLVSNYTFSNTMIHATGTMQLCRVGNLYSTGSKDWTFRFEMYVLASWQTWLGLPWKHMLTWIQGHSMWPIFMSSIMDGGIWFIITVLWMGMWTIRLCMDNSERWWYIVYVWNWLQKVVLFAEARCLKFSWFLWKILLQFPF